MGFIEMRKRTDLSQKEVAKILGVSQGAVANWEKRTNYPTVDNLKKLAVLYGCTTDELLK